MINTYIGQRSSFIYSHIDRHLITKTLLQLMTGELWSTNTCERWLSLRPFSLYRELFFSSKEELFPERSMILYDHAIICIWDDPRETTYRLYFHYEDMSQHFWLRVVLLDNQIQQVTLNINDQEIVLK